MRYRREFTWECRAYVWAAYKACDYATPLNHISYRYVGLTRD